MFHKNQQFFEIEGETSSRWYYSECYQQNINKKAESPQEKEIKELKGQVNILKRILLIKNICTEEEINDIINSIDVEEKLIESVDKK